MLFFGGVENDNKVEVVTKNNGKKIDVLRFDLMFEQVLLLLCFSLWFLPSFCFFCFLRNLLFFLFDFEVVIIIKLGICR